MKEFIKNKYSEKFNDEELGSLKSSFTKLLEDEIKESPLDNPLDWKDLETWKIFFSYVNSIYLLEIKEKLKENQSTKP